MTTAKTTTRKAPVRKAAAKPEKTVAEQQLESFTGGGGKSKAIAFFHTQLPRLVTHIDHGEEAYQLIRRWDAMKTESTGEVTIDTLGEILPDLRRFVQMVYGENASAVINAHWNGNLWDFFREVN